MQPRIDEITQRFKGFTEGVRIVMLIDRGVSNSNKGSKRWINKIITTNHDEWVHAVGTLLEMQKYFNNPGIRLYASMNDRKLDKAIKLFKHAQIDLLDDIEARFYMKLNDRFCSCLMKPENKNSKYFLLDIDTKDTTEVDKFISDNLIEVVKTYPSKSGWHYIVSPFNVKLAQHYEIFIIQKDGLLLLNYLQEEQK